MCATRAESSPSAGASSRRPAGESRSTPVDFSARSRSSPSPKTTGPYTAAGRSGPGSQRRRTAQTGAARRTTAIPRAAEPTTTSSPRTSHGSASGHSPSRARSSTRRGTVSAAGRARTPLEVPIHSVPPASTASAVACSGPAAGGGARAPHVTVRSSGFP